MADFTDVGKHCSDPYCNQCDFLPFTCDCCKKVFCLDHFRYKDHNCSAAANKDQRVAVCPLCKQSFALVGADINEENVSSLWEGHLSSCTGSKTKPRCAANSCKEKLTDLNTYACPQCRSKVCMKHRYEDDHQCKERKAALRSSTKQNWFGRKKVCRCGTCPECAASKAKAAQEERDRAAKAQWSCGACTLVNPKASKTCGACARPRISPRDQTTCVAQWGWRIYAIMIHSIICFSFLRKQTVEEYNLRQWSYMHAIKLLLWLFSRHRSVVYHLKLITVFIELRKPGHRGINNSKNLLTSRFLVLWGGAARHLTHN